VLLFLSALWLAAVQAFASVGPAGLRASMDAPTRVASVGVSASAPTGWSGSSAETELGTTPWTLLLGDGEFGLSAPQRLPAVSRVCDRGVSLLRSPLGSATLASATLSLASASVAASAAHRVSHAAASRGGHLPYYPTAPPLQG